MPDFLLVKVKNNRITASVLSEESYSEAVQTALLTEDTEGLDGSVILPNDQEQVDELRAMANALQTIIGAFVRCPTCGMRSSLDTPYCVCGEKLRKYTEVN